MDTCMEPRFAELQYNERNRRQMDTMPTTAEISAQLQDEDQQSVSEQSLSEQSASESKSIDDKSEKSASDRDEKSLNADEEDAEDEVGQPSLSDKTDTDTSLSESASKSVSGSDRGSLSKTSMTGNNWKRRRNIVKRRSSRRSIKNKKSRKSRMKKTKDLTASERLEEVDRSIERTKKKLKYAEVKTIYAEDKETSVRTNTMRETMAHPRFGMQSHVDDFVHVVRRKLEPVTVIEEVDVPIADTVIETEFKKQIYKWGKHHHLPIWASAELLKKISDETDRRKKFQERKINCKNLRKPWRWPTMWRNYFPHKGDIRFPTIATQKKSLKDNMTEDEEATKSDILADEALLLTDIIQLICHDKVTEAENIVEGGVVPIAPWEDIHLLRSRNKLFSRPQVEENTMRSMALVNHKPGDHLPGKTGLNTERAWRFRDDVSVTMFKKWKKHNATRGVVDTKQERMKHVAHPH